VTIEEILEVLRAASIDQPVVLDFCGAYPTAVGSWRGAYSKPAIGWNFPQLRLPGERPPTVGEVVAELEEATDGRIYFGWKGGEYKFTRDQWLWVDNPGECTYTEITGVSVGEVQVIIHTAYHS
jgi:hypothetical protein